MIGKKRRANGEQEVILASYGKEICKKEREMRGGIKMGQEEKDRVGDHRGGKRGGNQGRKGKQGGNQGRKGVLREK